MSKFKVVDRVLVELVNSSDKMVKEINSKIKEVIYIEEDEYNKIRNA